MPDGREPDLTLLQPVRPPAAIGDHAGPSTAFPRAPTAGSDVGNAAETLAALEQALARERAAREEAERLLRAARERVDEDLEAALEACHRLDREKLAAFGLLRPDDADVFETGRPAASIGAFTWDRLREDLEAEHRSELERRDAQLRELAERHRRDLEMMDDRAGALRQAVERQSSLEAELHQAAADRAEAATTLAAVTSELEGARGELDEARAALAVTRQRLDDVYGSASWKASRPLRGVARLLGNPGKRR